jgi:hypothetical protein
MATASPTYSTGTPRISPTPAFCGRSDPIRTGRVAYPSVSAAAMIFSDAVYLRIGLGFRAYEIHKYHRGGIAPNRLRESETFRTLLEMVLHLGAELGNACAEAIDQRAVHDSDK